MLNFQNSQHKRQRKGREGFAFCIGMSLVADKTSEPYTKLPPAPAPPPPTPPHPRQKKIIIAIVLRFTLFTRGILGDIPFSRMMSAEKSVKLENACIPLI